MKISEQKLGTRNTLSLFYSLIYSLSTCWTTFVFMSKLKTHSHTFSLSLFQSLIHSLLTCWTTFFTCLCSKLAIYRWKWQCFFLPQPHHPIAYPGSQLKTLGWGGLTEPLPYGAFSLSRHAENFSLWRMIKGRTNKR